MVHFAVLRPDAKADLFIVGNGYNAEQFVCEEKRFQFLYYK